MFKQVDIMLTYILAIAVALGSFGLYMAAFFFPEVYRKYDFIWSGVGLFYALVLWVCAERITGGVLLGQTASVAMLGWLGWQTLTLRRKLTPPAQHTQVSPSVQALMATWAANVKVIQGNLQRRWSSKPVKPPIPTKLPPIPQPPADSPEAKRPVYVRSKPASDRPRRSKATPPRIDAVPTPISPQPEVLPQPEAESSGPIAPASSVGQSAIESSPSPVVNSPPSNVPLPEHADSATSESPSAAKPMESENPLEDDWEI